jgi:hypothetical protein
MTSIVKVILFLCVHFFIYPNFAKVVVKRKSNSNNEENYSKSKDDQKDIHKSDISQLNKINSTLIREDVKIFISSGKYPELLLYLDDIEAKLGHLIIDQNLPTLYSYRGIAYASHTSRNHEKASEAFQISTSFFPNDNRAWLNLGIHSIK